MLSTMPSVLARSVPPGSVESVNFEINGASGMITALLVPEVEGIRLIQIQTTRVTERPWNPEIDGPVALSHDHPDSVIEREPVEFVGANQAFSTTGLEVLGQIDFGSPAPSTWAAGTMLVLRSTGGEVLLAVPVTLFNGEPSIEIPSQPVRAEISRITRFGARVTLPAGAPPTVINVFSMDGVITIPKQQVAVSGGQTTDVELPMYLSLGASPGVFQTTLSIDGFAGEQFHFPFQVEAVLPPAPVHPVDPARNFAAIEALWQRQGGGGGPLGLPLAPAQRIGNRFLRRFAGGTLTSLDGLAKIIDRQWVRVHFLGFHCMAGSSVFGDEEPYFVIGVAATNGTVTRRFGPFEGIREGSWQTVSYDLAGRPEGLLPPVTVVLIGFEHDEGTPSEIEAEVRRLVEALPRKLADVQHPAGGELGSYVVADWLRDVGVGEILEAGAALLGMGDDAMQRDVFLVFNEMNGVIERRQYPIEGYMGDTYNGFSHARLLVGEGVYEVFFRFELVVEPVDDL